MTNVIPRRIILGPGPSSAHPRVLRAMSNPVMRYLDPDFFEILDEVSQMLSALYKTEHYSFVIAGTGSAGMEAGLVNLAEGDDEVLICNNGFFCRRMTLMADRLGVNYSSLDFEWGTAVDLNVLEDKLKKSSTKLVAVIHAETSTGVCNPIDKIGKLVRKNGSLFLVDCVTSLGGMNVRMDKWHIDAIYSGTQKCLSCPPGLSPVSFSERAVKKLSNRKSKVPNWYLDLSMITQYWSGKARVYHHTAPINMLYGLYQACFNILEEGLEKVIQRHFKMHQLLASELDNLGLELLVEESARLPMLNAVKIPEGKDDAQVRTTLIKEYNIEIGGGLGPLAGKIWRIGLMGETAKKESIQRLMDAFKIILN